MKYLRIVVAVSDDDLDYLSEVLDEFIENSDSIQGAYVSAPYNTRDEAIHRDSFVNHS